jgi:DNA modification methylase
MRCETRATVPLQLDAPPAADVVALATTDVVEPGDDTIRLLHGDNLDALRALVEEDTRIELAYMDPPFYTQRTHHRTKRKRNQRTGRIDRTSHLAFDDRWPTFESYLISLRERLALIRQLLTDDGCVVIHVDPNTSHYIKVMCDELFGVDAFASEIIWRYRRWPAKTKNFQRVHDVLLRYVRNPEAKPRFQQLYEPLAASTRATWGTAKQLAVTDGKGRRVRSSKTAKPSPGTPMGDVWEISVIAPVAKERTGYPTQKPEALLRRVIDSCSLPGDTVLDPYVGSGTTAVVAAARGRRAIGIDASAEAIDVASSRLRAKDVSFQHERVHLEFVSEAPAAE